MKPVKKIIDQAGSSPSSPLDSFLILLNIFGIQINSEEFNIHKYSTSLLDNVFINEYNQIIKPYGLQLQCKRIPLFCSIEQYLNSNTAFSPFIVKTNPTFQGFNYGIVVEITKTFVSVLIPESGYSTFTHPEFYNFISASHEALHPPDYEFIYQKLSQEFLKFDCKIDDYVDFWKLTESQRIELDAKIRYFQFLFEIDPKVNFTVFLAQNISIPIHFYLGRESYEKQVIEGAKTETWQLIQDNSQLTTKSTESNTQHLTITNVKNIYDSFLTILNFVPHKIFIFQIIFSILTGGSPVVQILLLRYLISIFAQDFNSEALILATIGIILFLFLTIGIQTANYHLQAKFKIEFEANLRMALFVKMPLVNISKIGQASGSEATQNSNAISEGSSAFVYFQTFLQLVIQIGCVLLILSTIKCEVGAIALIAILINVILFLRGQKRELISNFRLYAVSTNLGKLFLETARGILPIRAHTAELCFQGIYLKYVALFTDIMSKRNSLRIQTYIAINSIYLISSIILLLLAKAGKVQLVDLLLAMYWFALLPDLCRQILLYCETIGPSFQQLFPLMNFLKLDEEFSTLKLDNKNTSQGILETMLDLDSTFVDYQPANQDVRFTEINKINDFQLLVNQENMATIEVEALSTPKPLGFAIEFVNITAGTSENPIFQDLNLKIAPGEHIAIVGQSGSGKSTLVRMLLGFIQPTAGQILINHNQLDFIMQNKIRQHTAWVDESVYIWKKTLISNICYGITTALAFPIGQALNAINFFDILKKLPNGLNTLIGEAGSGLSGGEGQRVRLARAILRTDVKLVILDESFRGLQQDLRLSLLRKSRNLWHNATLFYITHDVNDVFLFKRVLVLKDGKIIEDGNPETLMQNTNSQLSTLLSYNEKLNHSFWKNNLWKVLTIENKTIKEKS